MTYGRGAVTSLPNNLRNLSAIYDNQVTGYQEQAQLLGLDYNIQSYLLSDGDLGDETDAYRTIRSFMTNRPEIFSVILFSESGILASRDSREVNTEVKEEIVDRIRSETRTDREIIYARPDENAFTKTKHIVLKHEDLQARNTEEKPDTVVPVEAEPIVEVYSEKHSGSGKYMVKVPALSWNVLRFTT